MKRMNIKQMALVLGVSALTFTGCKKAIDDFGTLNNNPNATTVPITSALLTNVLANVGGNVWGGGINTTAGLYCQYMSETQYTDISRYAAPTLNWDGIYAGDLYDLQNIINTNTNESTKAIAAANGSNANQIATARILKSYYYLMLTDAFGDIPYSQALQGKGTIAYDKQENVYPAIINELKEAVAQFDGGATVTGDVLYSGSITKWKKLANSLRAIAALRMSKANATLGKTEFAAAIAAGVIDANADNAGIVYPGGNYRNPIYNYYVITQRFDFAVSKTVTDYLSGVNDPRINAFGHTTQGFPYGLTRNDALAWQTLNPNFAFLLAFTNTPQTMPVYLVTAGQMYLARAEAARLGWTSEVTATMYTTGITLEMNRWGITGTTAIATYLAQPAVALGTGDAQKIAEQRWLSHFPDGNQGWAEWRRTGYPVLTPAPGSGKQVPRRIPYGPNEPLYNPTNYAAAAAGYSNNSQDAKVWWDK
ncbi:SusD/RagB family nutrient-binding outer membrane lipoprotein [Lacibacter luteus]|uniref:SusD/RagB family nutrient-binding outer membrane lipoprotein n=1 Tax=Lacibacter luteus TaxID=2508719 RepID=A0A4Q1CN12_9BACT|nr:SusD/RagB family nutrient-binding outer membrane lipoprotein [Lacibacter luteus]RXK62487.1 SusD/RagB family nutrient-binding outer membrane lipoprotein [Lacibacter luteus]